MEEGEGEREGSKIERKIHQKNIFIGIISKATGRDIKREPTLVVERKGKGKERRQNREYTSREHIHRNNIDDRRQL